ncbi:MAG: hypothetical protein HUJ68_00020 [Clostridia bacterium]|nr:hypothetical protein [Clostridia bacterium]
MLIEHWLMKRYGFVLNKKVPDSNEPYNPDNAPIWVFWWDGFDRAPDLVKKCLSYMQSNRKKHPIIMIDKNNFSNYVTIPDYIIKKVKKNEITLTHFSDILRVNLLYEKGGLWADSTVFFAKEISSEIFTREFFSIRIKSLNNFSVTDYQWSGFFIATPSKTQLMYFMKEFFNEYWKAESGLVDYLLIDYFFDIIRKKNEHVYQLFSNLPYSNSKLYSLISCMNNQYDASRWKEMTRDTSFFKLSWKQNFIEKNENQNTFYGRFMEGLL